MPFITEFERLQSVWTKLEQTDKPILIYGTGNGCEKLLSVFEQKNIRASGIFTSDDFCSKSRFAGFELMTLSEAERRYDDFTAVLAFGTSLSDVMARIDDIDSRHTLLAPELSVADDSFFEKEELLSRADKVRAVYSLLSDDKSREVFLSLCRYKITGELKYLRSVFSLPQESYTAILKPSEAEIYCDLGAYNGDTVRELLCYTGGSFCKIICFEPDMRNFRKCVKNLSGLDNIEFENSAAWGSDTQVYFSDSSGRQSSVGSGGRLTSARSLDSYLQGREVTYIKYDVEGADRQAILGSRETIKKYSPKICTAVYHRPYDFIDIPLLLDDINPGYKFYLRQYPYYPAWETNLFLVK